MSVCLVWLCALYLPDCLSVCLSPSICPSVCLPAYQPACCPYAHLSLCLSVHLVCLCVCLFSFFQFSAANLPALYMSVHPFSDMSVCLSVLYRSVCLSVCLSVSLSVCLSCLHFTTYIKKRLRIYPSLITAIWFLIGKTTKQTKNPKDYFSSFIKKLFKFRPPC